MDFSKPRSFAAKVGGAKVDSLLSDPTLVDDYKDILSLKPPRDDIVESSSNMGSVVVTPAAGDDSSKQLGLWEKEQKNGELEELSDVDEKVDNAQPEENQISETVRSSMISNTSSRYSMRSESYQNQLSDLPEREDDNGHEEEIELVLNESSSSEDETYNYSDSDFEDNLQERMKNIDVTSAGSFGHEIAEGDGNFIDEDIEGEDIIKGHRGIHGLELDSSDEDNEGMLHFGDDDIEEEDLEEDDDYRPLPPPKELDPDKLYALYPFNGPDTSHCQLEQDEACILLNDQDAYWWLVKRCSDKKIGFAPAEILETFPERLARLNCWKNENMSTHSFIRSDGTIERIYDSPSEEEEEEEGELEDKEENKEVSIESNSKHSTPEQNSDGNNKSVSFKDVVEYAERFIDEDYDDSDNDESNELKHHDEYSEGLLEENNLYGPDGIIDDDDVSEVASDVSFGTNNMAPLNVKKVRVQPTKISNDILDESNEELDKEELKTSNATGLRKDGLGRSSSLKDDKDETNSDEDEHYNLEKQVSHDSKGEQESKVSDELNIDEQVNKSLELDNLKDDELEFAEPEADSDDEDDENVLSEDINKEELEAPEDDTVFKVFEAPNMPFASTQVGMQSSNSNYSISTIGEYSPSSGEFVAESPTSEKMMESNAIPSSKAVRDIADLIKSDGDQEDNQNNSKISDEHKDDTSVSSMNDEDGFDMNDANHELGSSTSLNSAFSSSKNLPSRSGSSISSDPGKHHPIVQELYNPMFLQMDTLLQQLDDIVK